MYYIIVHQIYIYGLTNVSFVIRVKKDNVDLDCNRQHIVHNTTFNGVLNYDKWRNPKENIHLF